MLLTLSLSLSLYFLRNFAKFRASRPSSFRRFIININLHSNNSAAQDGDSVARVKIRYENEISFIVMHRKQTFERDLDRQSRLLIVDKEGRRRISIKRLRLPSLDYTASVARRNYRKMKRGVGKKSWRVGGEGKARALCAPAAVPIHPQSGPIVSLSSPATVIKSFEVSTSPSPSSSFSRNFSQDGNSFGRRILIPGGALTVIMMKTLMFSRLVVI